MLTLPTAQLMSSAQNPASRRPELRVTTDSSLVFLPPSPQSSTDTPSDTADVASPTDTVTDEVPPSSSDSPYAPGVVTHFTVPLTRAAPGNMHAPYQHTHLLPDPVYRFGSAPQQPAAGPSSSPSSAATGAHAPRRLTHSSSLDSSWSSASSSRAPLAHPYARIYAKKAEAPSVKRRKMWNHALEKSVFTPEEIATLGAPNRRAIYTASLEYHIDQLHNQLLSLGLYPVPMESLEPYRGLNSKTAKVGFPSRGPVLDLTTERRAW